MNYLKSLCPWALSVAVLLAASSPDTLDSATVIYARAEVVESLVGQVELRRGYSKQIVLPKDECEGEPFSCTDDLVYRQIYSLSFSEEFVRSESRVTKREKTDRGRLFIAFDFEVEDERRFEDDLKTYLESMSTVWFSKPQAGMRDGVKPLRQRVQQLSRLPAWICRETDNKFACHILIDRGDGARTYGRTGEIAKSACRAMADAVSDAVPDIYRTSPVALTMNRLEVELESVSTIDGLTWSDELAPLPEGATLAKKNESETGLSSGTRKGVFRGKEGRYNDVQRDVEIPAATLDLLEKPMWVTRWTFRETRERFGTDPDVERHPAETIVLSVLPIEDSTMEPLVRDRTSLEVPRQLLLDEVISRFENAGRVQPRAVTRAFQNPKLWPARGDWMIVACYDDGKARYGIAPFALVADVQNPSEACAAIVRELADYSRTETSAPRSLATSKAVSRASSSPTSRAAMAMIK